MRTYTIINGSGEVWYSKAPNAIQAIHKWMDKRYKSWYGPTVQPDGTFDIYSEYNQVLTFKVQ